MNANIFSRKIEMTKAEAKAAGKIGSEKFKELQARRKILCKRFSTKSRISRYQCA